MSTATNPDTNWRRLRYLGRILLAVAAGAGFAALAWEPVSPSPADNAVTTDDGRTPAERPGIVTEDDAAPQLSAQPGDRVTPEEWGLSGNRRSRWFHRSPTEARSDGQAASAGSPTWAAGRRWAAAGTGSAEDRDLAFSNESDGPGITPIGRPRGPP